MSNLYQTSFICKKNLTIESIMEAANSADDCIAKLSISCPRKLIVTYYNLVVSDVSQHMRGKRVYQKDEYIFIADDKGYVVSATHGVDKEELIYDDNHELIKTSLYKHGDTEIYMMKSFNISERTTTMKSCISDTVEIYDDEDHIIRRECANGQIVYFHYSINPCVDEHSPVKKLLKIMVYRICEISDNAGYSVFFDTAGKIIGIRHQVLGDSNIPSYILQRINDSHVCLDSFNISPIISP